jgi:hypothetical protein
MVLVVEFTSGERKQYILHKVRDFDKVFEDFPQTHEIALSSDTVEDAAKNIAEYLDSHHMTAWIESEDIMKSWKEKVGGILTAAALGMNAGQITDHNPAPKTQMAAEKPKFQAPKKGFEKEDSFLNATGFIESTHGQNTDHAPIKGGKFKGMRAIGRYGLLEPTVKEMLKRRTDAKEELHPDVKALEGMNRDQLDAAFKANPELETDVARSLARHVLKRHKGNLEAASYSWLHGHNLKPENLPASYRSDPYVKGFKENYTPPPLQMVIKSEKMRSVAEWEKKRREKIRENTVRSTDKITDTGRKIDVTQADIPNKNKKANPRTTIKQAIENAKKAVKKS